MVAGINDPSAESAAQPRVDDAKRPEPRVREQREKSPVRAARAVCIAPTGLNLNPLLPRVPAPVIAAAFTPDCAAPRLPRWKK